MHNPEKLIWIDRFMFLVSLKGSNTRVAEGCPRDGGTKTRFGRTEQDQLSRSQRRRTVAGRAVAAVEFDHQRPRESIVHAPEAADHPAGARAQEGGGQSAEPAGATALRRQ